MVNDSLIVSKYIDNKKGRQMNGKNGDLGRGG